MSNCKSSPEAKFPRLISVVLAVIAAVLLLLALKFPLWQMHLEAPQYRDEEALNIAVHPNAFRGDMHELAVLNQYIGVHVPETLPQFKWLPAALIAAAVLGVSASLLRRSVRSRALTFVCVAISAALLAASVQAMTQMRDIGHKRDHKTILVGVKDFTPPFLGTSKIAQFTVTSRFGLGAWLIGGALALQLSAAWLSRKRKAGFQSSSAAETDACDTDLSLAPGFSPVNTRGDESSAASAAFRARETVKTVSTTLASANPGPKSGANETKLLCCAETIHS